MTERNKTYLSEIAKGRNNNLDIMRFIAAMLVIFSHSVPISMGAERADAISEWTDGRLSFGAIAVGVFFVTGGYLIAGSAERKNTVKAFFKARCSRIFPQLIFVTVLMTFIVGPIISGLTMGEYYRSSGSWKYLLNSVFILQHNLPGVFDGNIYGNTVNGPLWTLPVEFMCYIMCFIAYKIRIMSKEVFKFTIPIAIIMAILSIISGNVFMITVLRPVILFYIGMGIYVYRSKIEINSLIGTISILLFIFCIFIKADSVAMYIIFPYMIYYIAFGLKYKFYNFGKRGEFSYGMYLWGWPVAQTICMIFGGEMHWLLNAVLTSIVASILGIVNYYVIDYNINRLQKKRKA